MSIIHNIVSCSEKVVSSKSWEKSAHIKQSLQPKTVLNKDVDFNERYYELVFWTAGRYTGSNGKSIWITDTVWIKKKKENMTYRYKRLSNVNCRLFWLMIGELLELLINA